MDNFSHFRRRRYPSRSEYTLLDNDQDGSQYSHSIRSYMTADSNSSRPHRLCDKCWEQHTRSTAVKRCLDCKQNLCNVCARKDTSRHPWWLPACLAQCMNFFFCYVFKSHKIVDVKETETRGEHWALRPEVSSINRIPRVSRESPRHRNNSRTPLFTNQGENHNRYSGSKEQLITRGQPRPHEERVSRSKSYEEGNNRPRLHPRNPKRSISVDKINRQSRFTRERREREKIYNQNWDSPSKFDRRPGAPHTHGAKPYISKVKGKDIDIVIAGSEMKLAVNKDKSSDKNGKKDGQKDGIFRRKSKTKAKDASSYEPYTEELFSENPIWFKRDSSKKNKEKPNASHKDSNKTNDTGAGISNGAFEDVKENVTRDYTVEEPPDQCPICLEDLPGQEARILSCSHVIHTKCLVYYIKETDNLDFGIRCPVCKSVTKIKNYYAQRELWYREVPISSVV